MATKTICDRCGKVIPERKQTYEIQVNRLVNSNPDDRDWVENLGEFCKVCIGKIKQLVVDEQLTESKK
jgi:hypothetical protein